MKNFQKLSLAVFISAAVAGCNQSSDDVSQSEVDDLRAQLEELQGQQAPDGGSAEIIAGLQQEIEELRGQITDLEDGDNSEQVAALEQQIAELETQIETLEDDQTEEVAALEQQIADLEGQIAGLQQTTGESSDEIAELKNSLTELEQLVAGMADLATQAELEELRQALVSLNSNINGSIADEIKSLQNQIARLNHYYVGNLNLAQVQMVYSHNSYDTREDRWPNTSIEAQLDAGVRVLELDLWDIEGTIAHDDATVAQHCADIDACLKSVSDWSEANPGHAPIVIQFEMTDNGEFVEPGDPEDAQLNDRSTVVQAKVDLLAEKLAPLSESGKLISYEKSLKNIDQLRNKFLVTLYRKYNTPYFSDRAGGFSKRQTITLNKALELTTDTENGVKYRNLLKDNSIFLSARYIADESPDGWTFADADFEAQLHIEREAGLENKMLRVLKQDGASYVANGFTENTFMISNVDKRGNYYSSIDSNANAIGTHKLENIRQDVVANALLEMDGIAPHCQRSGRDYLSLVHCGLTPPKVVAANPFAPSNNSLKIAIIPDTQGRDDDKYRDAVTLPDGSKTHSGMDFNYRSLTDDSIEARDGYFDGDGYLIDVSAPFNPVAVLDEATGEAIKVAVEDRQDSPTDFKHLPYPLVQPMVQKIIAEEADMAIAIGDMTDYRTELEYVEWIGAVTNPLEEADIGVYPIRGNHEIVDGRDWSTWFSYIEEPKERKSVDNAANGISVYTKDDENNFDQGYKLYSHYAGQLIKDKMETENITGYPGIEDLVYWFIKDNTLFIALDTYASDLVNTQYQGTWSTFFPWVKDVIETNADSVDHIIVYAHEALITKKRPHLYDYQEYNNYLAGEAEAEPGIQGIDVSQMGYLEQQAESSPGIDKEMLSFFSKHKVLYLAGHDHQYSRSAIHSEKGDKSSDWFMQLVTGNSSWKSYNNRYGESLDYETLIAQDNFINPKTEKTTKVSFTIIEIDGPMMSITNWYAKHDMSEDDMTRGARYINEEGMEYWLIPDENEEDGARLIPVVWEKGDTTTFAKDSLQRLVRPLANYAATTKTPANAEGYIGTEASILEGYNLTYNSTEVFRADASDYSDINGDGTGMYLPEVEGNEYVARRVDNLSEMLSLSWLADESPITVSDILFIDGTRNQDGTFDSTNGFVQPISPSEFYFNKDGDEVPNRTNTERDGKITDEDAADSMAIAITAPTDVDVKNLTLAKYNESTHTWEPIVNNECFVNTGYSDDFSSMYAKSDRGPEGPEKFPSEKRAMCSMNYWGYNTNANAVWSFIHTDGKFALISND